MDDEVVDTYGAELVRMNDRITRIRGGKDRIGFKSLTDIFAMNESERSRLDELIPNIDHHIPTRLSSDSELCRRVLMLGFQTGSADLKQRIKSEEVSVLALYRGFSKFMLEDLDQNVYTELMSRSQRRKLSSKVAFEMIRVSQSLPFSRFLFPK